MRNNGDVMYTSAELVHSLYVGLGPITHNSHVAVLSYTQV